MLAVRLALAMAFTLCAASAQARNVVADTAQIAAILKAMGRTAEVSVVSGKPFVYIRNLVLISRANQAKQLASPSPPQS